MNAAVMVEWWEHHDELARLWRWLDERDETPDDPAYFMSKPWKWGDEHAQMCAEQEKGR